MHAARQPSDTPEDPAGPRRRIIPHSPAQSAAAPRRVEERPPLAMVLAPLIGLLIWAGLITLVV